MDWASGADRHQKTALQKVRAFFLERGGGARAQRTRVARRSWRSLIAGAEAARTGRANLPAEADFCGIFWKTYIFQDPKAIFKIHRERADTLSWY